jgi:hypothetical protein
MEESDALVGVVLIEREAALVAGSCFVERNDLLDEGSVAPMGLAVAGSIYFTRPRLAHHVRTARRSDGARATFSAVSATAA